MKKILLVEVVEDDASQRSVLREKLSNEGFSILEAKDGEEGLEIALREHPDVILLDIVMPKMSGMTMMHKLREDAWGQSASVIILTNYDTNDPILSNVVRDHPSYYFIKSNTPLEKVLEKIQEISE